MTEETLTPDPRGRLLPSDHVAARLAWYAERRDVQTTISCSWCHTQNPRDAIHCRACGHQNVPRAQCRCPQCCPTLKRVRDLVLAAEAERSEPLEAWQLNRLLAEMGHAPDDPRIWQHAQRCQLEAARLRTAARSAEREYGR